MTTTLTCTRCREQVETQETQMVGGEVVCIACITDDELEKLFEKTGGKWLVGDMDEPFDDTEKR